MRLIIAQIVSLFHELDQEVSQFASASGISCAQGCGACCLSPEIETTVAEMLPLAWKFFQEGQAESQHAALQNAQTELCLQYRSESGQPQRGNCSNYADRPSLCRLFGYSGYRDRLGSARLGTCQIIQARLGVQLQSIEQRIQAGQLSVPFLSHAHERIAAIGGNLAWDMLPINEALRRAIEIIGLDRRLQEEPTPHCAP